MQTEICKWSLYFELQHLLYRRQGTYYTRHKARRSVSVVFKRKPTTLLINTRSFLLNFNTTVCSINYLSTFKKVGLP